MQRDLGKTTPGHSEQPLPEVTPCAELTTQASSDQFPASGIVVVVVVPCQRLRQSTANRSQAAWWGVARLRARVGGRAHRLPRLSRLRCLQSPKHPVNILAHICTCLAVPDQGSEERVRVWRVTAAGEGLQGTLTSAQGHVLAGVCLDRCRKSISEWGLTCPDWLLPYWLLPGV